jgi:YVTN family beta-propeller protein/VCBS repeat-containing protein
LTELSSVIGLNPAASPNPATPIDALGALVWGLFRRIESTFTNSTPRAVDDAVVTSEDLATTGNVLSNDTDADGDPLKAALVTGPQHGTVALNSDGSFTYTPTADYNGTETFTYKVSDDTGGFHLHGLFGLFSPDLGHTDTATVTIAVTPVNDAPVAHNDAYSTTQDQPLTVGAHGVLANDTDVDNTSGQLSAVLGTGPAHGTLTLNPNGSFTYTPSANFTGTDSFAYRTTDGTASSAPATVNITVTPPPITAAFDHYTLSVTEGNSGINTVPLTVTLSAPSTETVTVNYKVESAGLSPLATANVDFVAETGTLVFAPGQTAATLPLKIYGDTTYEPDEYLHVALTGATGAILSLDGPTSQYLTINNDDTPTAAAALSDMLAADPPVVDSTQLSSPTPQLLSATKLTPVVVPANDTGSATTTAMAASAAALVAPAATPSSAAAVVSPTVIATIPVGSSEIGPDGTFYTVPAGVAVSPNGTRVYVTNAWEDTVSVIDTTTPNPTVIATIQVGRYPMSVAVSPDGTRVYVSNHLDTMWVIDTSKANISLLAPAVSSPSLQQVVAGIGAEFRVVVSRISDWWSGFIGSLTPTSPSTKTQSPTTAAKLYARLRDTAQDSPNSLWVDKIDSPDGTRYVVYLGGTLPLSLSINQANLVANVPAYNGTIKGNQIDLIMKAINADGGDPNAPIMLVGYSQGGLDAQNIALEYDSDSSSWLTLLHDQHLNITTVVTFGTPIIYGVPTSYKFVDIEADGDPVPDIGNTWIPGISRTSEIADNKAAGNVYPVRTADYHQYMDQWWNLKRGLDLHGDPATYKQAGAAFDGAAGYQAVKSSIKGFSGTVVQSWK